MYENKIRQRSVLVSKNGVRDKSSDASKDRSTHNFKVSQAKARKLSADVRPVTSRIVHRSVSPRPLGQFISYRQQQDSHAKPPVSER